MSDWKLHVNVWFLAFGVVGAIYTSSLFEPFSLGHIVNLAAVLSGALYMAGWVGLIQYLRIRESRNAKVICCAMCEGGYGNNGEVSLREFSGKVYKNKIMLCVVCEGFWDSLDDEQAGFICRTFGESIEFKHKVQGRD